MRLIVRRRICRLIFWTCCLLPTCGVAASLIVLHSPMYGAAQRRAWQTRLSAALGMDVELAEVRSLGGSRWLVRGVECRDPESNEWLVRVRTVDVARTQRGWKALLGQPQVRARRIGRLADLVHEQVLGRAGDSGGTVDLGASAVELCDESYSESVLDVRSALRHDADGPELLVEFRAAHATEDQRVRARFARNRQLDPPATGWELHTGAGGLPCSVALHWLPALRQLGDDCVFQGSVWCEPTRGGPEVEVRGIFRDLDLDTLVTARFPHKLGGLATLAVDPCRIQDGHFTQVDGRLSAPGGVISQSVLDAAERLFGFQQYPRRDGADPLAYRQLAIDFSLTSTALIVAASERSGTVIADQQGPLLSIQQPESRSPLSLVHLLVPPAHAQVPVTRETAALLQFLPLSAAEATAATARGDGRVPVRLERR